MLAQDVEALNGKVVSGAPLTHGEGGLYLVIDRFWTRFAGNDPISILSVAGLHRSEARAVL